MRLNKKLQYGLLFALYLSRSGRATLDIISQNLDVSQSFLEQIARKLRIMGVVKSIRGPSGGYELIDGMTVGMVINALQTPVIMSSKEASVYARGELEHRALARMANDMAFSLTPVFRMKIKDVVGELVRAENYVMERADYSARPN